MGSSYYFFYYYCLAFQYLLTPLACINAHSLRTSLFTLLLLHNIIISLSGPCFLSACSCKLQALCTIIILLARLSERMSWVRERERPFLIYCRDERTDTFICFLFPSPLYHYYIIGKHQIYAILLLQLFLLSCNHYSTAQPMSGSGRGSIIKPSKNRNNTGAIQLNSPSSSPLSCQLSSYLCY